MPLLCPCHLAVVHFSLQYPYAASHILGFQLPCLSKTRKLQKRVENEKDIEKHLILHSAKGKHTVARNGSGTEREEGEQEGEGEGLIFTFQLLSIPQTFTL